MHPLETRLPAPVVAALIGAAMKWHAVSASVAIDPSRWRMLLGLGLAQLAGLIALLAFAGFWRARTTIDPLHPQRASRLVTGGIYRLSRNPIYLSLAMLLVAYALRLDSAWPALGPVVFVAYVTRFQIVPEERALAARFGEAYAAYARRTRRWL
ncbi:isoprenylcysteine carboxylmethyltransferase family protein [Piscinibacter sakaiensis]|uniref:Protein-S-isoprenylcysteine methyltransferase n=1 Tax=Piscinibacter sakaiensis TaxID=1547922 RepID=A0A0K8P1E3_PISS1|nr:isoprenylcysteine carboxylmethyltransferase family protein [Piscinibacter sakaiensis]GAP35990.1 putative protein-S-isoprenylcysteine methyltransferase [Piscinibacter sakaiensis]